MCKANLYKERPFAPKFSYTLTFLYFKSYSIDIKTVQIY